MREHVGIGRGYVPGAGFGCDRGESGTNAAKNVLAKAVTLVSEPARVAPIAVKQAVGSPDGTRVA